MRRFILFYLLTVSALFIYGDHPETLYKKGQEALKSHRYEEAISLFTLAIRNYRESSGICLHCLYRDRGRANCNLNRSNLALSDLTRALELDPKDPGGLAYYYRGLTYDDLKQFPRALADYSMALKINPGYANAAYNRGLLFARHREYRKALSDFTHYLSLKSNDPDAYYNRGTAFFQLGEYQAALKDFNALIKLAPRDKNGYLQRGMVHRKLKHFEQAIDDLTDAIQLNPKSADAYFQRGESYFDHGEFDRAYSDYLFALRFKPNSGQVYYALARFYAKGRKDRKKTIEYLEKAIRKGYNNLEWLKKDSALSIVRNLKEFRELLDQLAQRQREAKARISGKGS